MSADSLRTSVFSEVPCAMDATPFCSAEHVLSSSNHEASGQTALSRARINTSTQPPQLLVQVLVEGPDGSHLTLPVHTTDTVKELKMALSNKSWFTNKHCLFFGNRQLLDHQQVAEIVCPMYLYLELVLLFRGTCSCRCCHAGLSGKRGQ